MQDSERRVTGTPQEIVLNPGIAREMHVTDYTPGLRSQPAQSTVLVGGTLCFLPVL